MTGSKPDETTNAADTTLAAFSKRMVDIAERWFPDAYVYVLVAVVAVALAAVLHGGSPMAVSQAFGDGFWNLLPFAMQMILVAVGGYVVSMSSPAAAVLRGLARVPRIGRGAVVFVGVLSILLSLMNWGLSLIFSGMLVREIARRKDFRLDYRAAGAAGYLGLGCAVSCSAFRPRPPSYRRTQRPFRRA
jgi:short-chain fatty acids transporter